MTKQILHKGFLTYIHSELDDSRTETHYAVSPTGEVLMSGGFRLNCRNFGPKVKSSWVAIDALPEGVEFIGNYFV